MADMQPSQTRATSFESAHAAERDLETVHAPSPVVETPAKGSPTRRGKGRIDWRSLSSIAVAKAKTATTMWCSWESLVRPPALEARGRVDRVAR